MKENFATGSSTEAGSVSVSDVFATDQADLWQALTDPERLRRWIAEVDGDLRLGGRFTARFTSGWEGTGEVLVCERPDRLVVATTQADGETTTVEALLETTPAGTRLVLPERGIRAGELAAYQAGWRVHLDDLGRLLRGEPAGDVHQRWQQLMHTADGR